MNPANFTLNNTRTVLVIYFIIMMMGVKTFFTIGRLEYPEFTMRKAQIITAYPGRTTVQVEEELTEPLEQSIRQMREVDNVKSTSKPGLSVITVEVKEQYFDMEDIWTDLRTQVDATQLPDGARTPMINDDFGDVFPYLFALKSDGLFTPREMSKYAERIEDELLKVEGVAKVELHGEQEERIYLEFSSAELAAIGLTPDRVASLLRAQNAVVSSGDILVGSDRITVTTKGEFQSLEAIANYPLAIPGQATSVRVSDYFTIHREYVDPPRSYAHYSGERTISIAVAMTHGGVVTEIGERVQKRIDEIERTLPIGLDIETQFFQPKYVDKSIRDFLVNLGQAFFFVVLVMLLFAGWRIAMIVGVLVPSAVLMSFTLMPALGVVLEMMSIAALIIALGLLVDNAVVVSEQILVRLGEGMERKKAVVDSTGELMIPLLAASATTIAAFSPIALAEGATSEFTYSLFAVVSLTLLSSWILSLTVIPLFCYYFLKPLKKDTFVGRGLNNLYGPYERFLRCALKLRWVYPSIILVLTVISVWGFRFVPNIFFPPNERGQFVVDFELPLGTDISITESEVQRLERWLLSERADLVESVSAWIGNGGPRWYMSLSPEPPNPNYASLSVLTKTADPVKVARLARDVGTYSENQFPDARVLSKPLENGPPVGDPIQIRLYGPDLETVYELRDEIVAAVKDIPGLYDVRDDWGAWVKQRIFTPDPVKAARLGLTTSSIANALNQQYTGGFVTNFRDGEDSIPVLMRAIGKHRNQPETMIDQPLFTSVGAVPLGQVGSLELSFVPGSVKREDTLRVMTIKGRVRDRFASEVLADIRPGLDDLAARKTWPVGYHIEYGGEQEESAKAQKGIAAPMPVSLSILALILIAQFNSLRRFFIIVLTIPPMLCGVVPGLLITGSSFGFMTLLGIIALLGIIVNNAILLIDETDKQIGGGLEVVAATIAAAKSRLRPIVLTTITTIIGLMPLAISGGGMWRSMAFAMMFGLGFATLLTLVLCPVLFSLFFSKKSKERPKPKHPNPGESSQDTQHDSFDDELPQDIRGPRPDRGIPGH